MTEIYNDGKALHNNPYIYYQKDGITIYCGDTLETLKQIPDESVDVIITSPPYFGMRNYGIDKQIGLEEQFDCGKWSPTTSCGQCYMCRMLDITWELKRVLKKSGSIFWNHGDAYGAHSSGNKFISEANMGLDEALGGRVKSFVLSADRLSRHLKPKYIREKCMMMQPERLALNMVDKQDFTLRQKIIWAKQILIRNKKKGDYTIGSCMPTSTKDRFNMTWEYLFHFTKSKKYYSDLDAVRIPSQVVGITDLRPVGIIRQSLYKNSKYHQEPSYGGLKFNLRVRDARRKAGQPRYVATKEEIEGYKNRWQELKEKSYGDDDKGARRSRVRAWLDIKNKYQSNPDLRGDDKGGPGSYRLWKDTHPYQNKLSGIKKEAEEDGNPRAGAKRKTDLALEQKLNRWMSDTPVTYPPGKNIPTVWQINPEPHNFRKELGVDIEHFATYPEALCDIPIKFATPPNGIVLDPFMGSGTTLVVAKKLGFKAIGIDLNEGYCEIAKRRLEKIQKS